MKKAIWFGASEGVKYYFDTTKTEYEVIAFADNAEIRNINICKILGTLKSFDTEKMYGNR